MNKKVGNHFLALSIIPFPAKLLRLSLRFSCLSIPTVFILCTTVESRFLLLVSPEPEGNCCLPYRPTCLPSRREHDSNENSPYVVLCHVSENTFPVRGSNLIIYVTIYPVLVSPLDPIPLVNPFCKI